MGLILYFKKCVASIWLRQNTAIWNIAFFVQDGVITMDELEGFSEDLQNAVKLILSR